ncbi:hypothetical protein Dimus_035069 [Dionaea muscipula]
MRPSMSPFDTSNRSCGLQRLPSKRKLDDFSPTDEGDDAADGSITIRMRKLDSPPNPKGSICGSSSSRSGHHHSAVAGAETMLHPSVTAVVKSSKSQLQFFVRMFSGGKTLVLRAKLKDTVEVVHEMIEAFTGIPVVEQRLIYGGKQLQLEQTLAECSVQDDAELQLVARMRSTVYPIAWQVIVDMIYLISRLLKNDFEATESDEMVMLVKERLEKYVAGIPRKKKVSNGFVPDIPGKRTMGDLVVEYLKIFIESNAHKALVMFYMSPKQSYKDCADQCIQHFLTKVVQLDDKQPKAYGATIVLEFCKLLSHTVDDLLYIYCRSTLGSIVLDVGIAELGKIYCSGHYIVLADILPFFREVAGTLAKDMLLGVAPDKGDAALGREVTDFSAFLHPLRSLISNWAPFNKRVMHPFGEETEVLHGAYFDIIRKMDHCLEKMEWNLAAKQQTNGGTYQIGCRSFLCILKELNSIADLFQDDRVVFQAMIRNRKVSLQALIVRHAGRNDDHAWLFRHKDALDFVSRRHLAMLMFPDKEQWEEMHEMLIDREQLLPESFEYISQAKADSLRAGIFMEFKNEEATGPGVLREWFFLVCQAIFNSQNVLFATCPHDRRRFFPNPASKVDPMHLRYFHFSGRVVALALMHKVQVGIVLDRIFFVQLAGEEVSLEDIRDADPYMYNSCKQILEMDAELIDSDALGLTFVWEVEELGSRKVVELFPGGKSIVVNSSNREKYIKLLIKYRFVKSISNQVSEFAGGFSDVVGSSANRKTFFRSLELEDFDSMLHGSGSAISVQDWKEHTEYNGYGKSDSRIRWFWEIVGQMSPEQKMVLLFFWTSIKYLPVDGFRGLASRLFIYKSSESIDSLPSSHTCFYRLCIPPYPSMDVMQKRLAVITQEYVGCSFGTW